MSYRLNQYDKTRIVEGSRSIETLRMEGDYISLIEVLFGKDPEIPSSFAPALCLASEHYFVVKKTDVDAIRRDFTAFMLGTLNVFNVPDDKRFILEKIYELPSMDFRTKKEFLKDVNEKVPKFIIGMLLRENKDEEERRKSRDEVPSDG